MISIIAALSENLVIGRGGSTPWHLPPDLRRFRDLTMGTVCIMGRHTYLSLPHGLPGRRCIVLSHEPLGHTMTCHRLADAIEYAGGSDVSICGGTGVYAEALSYADRLLLTIVHLSLPGDALFPWWYRHGFTLTDRTAQPPHDGLGWHTEIWRRL